MSEKEGIILQQPVISQPIPQVSQQTAGVFAPQNIKQQTKISREELLKEAQKILKQQPSLKPKSKQEVDSLLVDNYEVLLEIKKEYAKRKNANLFNSDLLNQIYEFEKNLIKLCRGAPPSIIYELEVLRKNKSLVTAHSRMQKALLPLPQSKIIQQQAPQPLPQQQQQQQYSGMPSIPKIPIQQQPLQGQMLPQQTPQQIIPQQKQIQQQQQPQLPHPQQIIGQQQRNIQGNIPHSQHNLGYQQQQQPQPQPQPHLNSQQHLGPNIPQQQVPYQQPPHPQAQQQQQYQQQQPLPIQSQQQQGLQVGIQHHPMQQPQQQPQQHNFQTY